MKRNLTSENDRLSYNKASWIKKIASRKSSTSALQGSMKRKVARNDLFLQVRQTIAQHTIHLVKRHQLLAGQH